MVLVMDNTGLDVLQASGIVGLSPTKDPITSLFIQQMKESGVIDEAVFAFNIGDERTPSSMILGGYDKSQFTPTWHDVDPTSDYWTTNLDGLKIVIGNSSYNFL